MIIFRRIGLLFCSSKRAQASMNMSAWTLFNDQKKGPNLPSFDLYTPYSKMAADLCGYKLAHVASFKIKYSLEV